MKLHLQYTSCLDKEHIKEAAKLKDDNDAKLKGWEHVGNGVFKRTYRKGNIVVKFNNQADNKMHMLKEILLYREAPKKYKKHLARIFGGDGTKIIQRFLDYDKKRSYSKEECNEIRKIGDTLGIGDYFAGTNVVKTRKGVIVFYDFSGHGLRNI
jgi:hypothetical protein